MLRVWRGCGTRQRASYLPLEREAALQEEGTKKIISTMPILVNHPRER